MMVECERGGEERCSGGDVRNARPGGGPANSAAVTAMSGSSYINRLEAVLAVRCVPSPTCCDGRIRLVLHQPPGGRAGRQARSLLRPLSADGVWHRS